MFESGATCNCLKQTKIIIKISNKLITIKLNVQIIYDTVHPVPKLDYHLKKQVSKTCEVEQLFSRPRY